MFGLPILKMSLICSYFSPVSASLFLKSLFSADVWPLLLIKKTNINSRATNPISIKLITVPKQPCQIRWKVKNAEIICYLVTSLVFLLPDNVQGKMMKTVNTGGENLHIFWATWAISMKFSGKMWTLIILKVTKKPALHDISRQHSIIKTTGEEGVEEEYTKFLKAWLWICKKGCCYIMPLYILNYIY